MRTGTRLVERQGVDPVGDRASQKRVVGGMELDLVDPIAPPIVGLQDRRAGVGEPREFLRLGARDLRAEGDQAVLRPVPSVSHDSLAQRLVRLVGVEVLKRRNLVRDLVRGTGIAHDVLPGVAFPGE